MKRTHPQRKTIHRSLFPCAVILAAVTACPTHAGELLLNGGFESGLTDWTVTVQDGSSGNWIATGDTTLPGSGFASAGPASGLSYAVSDQSGPGAQALTQSFTVPAGATKVLLSFDMFVNDWSGLGPIVDPAGLDYTVVANQHVRVDVLVAGANGLSTAPADVVKNLYIGVDPSGTNPNAYTSYLSDLTGILSAGSTYELRFGEVDNQFYLNAGVDNVSILATVPEPETYAMIGAVVLVGFAGYRRFRC